MPSLLRMPEVATDTTEAVVMQWQVQPNTPFRVGQPIVTVETAKAVVDVEAEADGVLLKALVEPGAAVPAGGPIALIGSVGEVVADIDSALAGLGVSTSAAHAGGSAREERIFASPLARRLARDSGLALAELQGTGPGERIVRRDVERAIAGRTSPNGAQPLPGTAPVPASPPAKPEGDGAAYTDIAHTRIRRAIAARLTESTTSAPHFYLRGTARVDRLLALRREINDEGTIKVSINDLVVKAVARAHTLVPALNVTWHGDTIRHYARVDIALAIATDAGLVTPVIRGVDRLSLGQLAAATGDVITRARTRRLQQAELEGGSITVTNLGMLGTEDFSAVINPPQAAILAVGAARPEAVVRDGAVEAATVLRVTLSIDHRPVDGATAAEWLRVFLDLLENPARILI